MKCSEVISAVTLLLTLATASVKAQSEANGNATTAVTLEEPMFIEEPSDVKRRVGETVVLPCKVANRNNGRVQWTRDGFGLGQNRSTDFPRYSVIGTNLDRDWDLQVEQIGVDDDAHFECQVVVDSRRSLRSKKAKLTVIKPPDAPFIQEGPVVQAKEGMQVKLTCVSRGGKPAAKINWFDHKGKLMDGAAYGATPMSYPKEKLWEATSVIDFYPSRDHDQTMFKCEAWNEADEIDDDDNDEDDDVIGNGSRRRRIRTNRSPAVIRIKVQYPPTVTVQAVRPGLIQEGSKASYRCIAEANPAPSGDSYTWYIDNDRVPNQFQSYFEIYNVSRVHHDKQVRCSVRNQLGKAEGLKSIQVKYGPTIVQQPRTTAGDNMSPATLFCAVDGNPKPKYHWTKGQSREIISQTQNLTVSVTDETVGTYFCHAEVSGYAAITSNPAEVLMTGKPNISSNPVQRGVVGDNVHIDCAAVTIPGPGKVVWRFHSTVIEENNSHYRIIESFIEHGIRSTLVIRQALETDFGPYTCTVNNTHGIAEMEIVLQQQRPIPLQMILIAVFSAVIFVLVFIILLILFRKRCCNDFGAGGGGALKAKDTPTSGKDNRNNLVKVNNLVDQLAAGNGSACSPTDSSESGWSAVQHRTCMEDDMHSAASTVHGGGGVGAMHPQAHAVHAQQRIMLDGSACMQSGNSSELLDPEFPPKPDVIDTGYVPYSNNLRDYNPQLLASPQDSIYGVSSRNLMGVLNVSDPRFSATYGNPYLRQGAGGGSRLLVPPTAAAPPPTSTTTFTSAQPPAAAAAASSSYSSSTVSSFHPSVVAVNNGVGANGGGNGGGGGTVIVGNLQRNPLVVSPVPNATTNNSHYTNNIVPMSSSTPNSSVSNMACLPEDPELVALGEDHTGVPGGGGGLSSSSSGIGGGRHNNPAAAFGTNSSSAAAHIRLANSGHAAAAGAAGSVSTASSSAGLPCTPSPPNLLPVSQPKVPNNLMIKTAAAAAPLNNQPMATAAAAQNRGQPHHYGGLSSNPRSPPTSVGQPINASVSSGGDATAAGYSTLPNNGMSSFGSPSVIGFGGPLYNSSSQTLSRINGNFVNNNPASINPAAAAASSARYASLGVNQPVSAMGDGGGKMPPAMTAAKPVDPTYSTVNKANKSGGAKVSSSMGTHV